MTLLPGTMLGSRYILGRVLGIGGFGITYKAFDTLYQQVCAVKEFAPSGLALRRPGELDMQVCGGSAVAYYQHGMTRFLEEAKMLKRLESVPAVVEVKECFQENNTAYFSMEFLDGNHLKKVVNDPGRDPHDCGDWRCDGCDSQVNRHIASGYQSGKHLSAKRRISQNPGLWKRQTANHG